MLISTNTQDIPIFTLYFLYSSTIERRERATAILVGERFKLQITFYKGCHSSSLYKLELDPENRSLPLIDLRLHFSDKKWHLSILI